MWFKNLRVYRLTKPFEMSASALGEALSARAFQPCGKQDLMQYGWVPPLGRHGQEFVHSTNGFMMVCAKKQEKILPAAVINEHLEEKVAQISQEEGRAVGRSERQNLKEEILFSLLPYALTRSQLQFAYIAPNENWIVINTTSAKKAEDMLGALRDAVGSLPVIPLTCKNMPSQSMTTWLTASQLPDGFEFGDECELEAPKDEGRTIRCKKQDLTADEITNHISTGMVVRKMALAWQNTVQCIIDQDLGIKRLKFSEEILDKVNERSPETAAEEFDLDFNIMTMELRGFLEAVQSAFGGINLKHVVEADGEAPF
jgi:recombination associated protein RdgC